MNVYDFDGTIYRGDSSLDFFLYALTHRPGIFRRFPEFLAAAIGYKTGKLSKTQWKEVFFSFLQDIADPAAMVNAFWRKNQKKIRAWYLSQKREDDVIISASPRFLLLPVCKDLGVQRIIASEVDIRDGRFSGKNCRGEEKLRRFRELFGEETVEEFYSDSLSDAPMATAAVQAYLVKKGAIREWPPLL